MRCRKSSSAFIGSNDGANKHMVSTAIGTDGQRLHIHLPLTTVPIRKYYSLSIFHRRRRKVAYYVTMSGSIVSESSRCDSHFKGVLNKSTQPTTCIFPVVYRWRQESFAFEQAPLCRDSRPDSA